MTQEVIQKLREFLLAENYELVLVSDFDEVPEENGKFCLLEGDSENQISYYLTGSTKSEAAGLIMKMKSSYLQLGFVIQLVSKFAEYNEAGKTGYFVSYTAREIVKAPECKTGLEAMFVKSVNGQSGDVFLDIPEKTSDLYNDSGFVDSDYVDEKVKEIQKGQVTSVNGQTGDVSLFIPGKVSDLKNDSDFISKQEADDKFQVKGDYATKTELGELDDKIDEVDAKIPTDYATKQEVKDVEAKIPTDYVSEEDFGQFVESQAATDLAQNKDISEIETVLEETNKVIKNNIPANTLSLDDETKDLPTNLQSLIDYKAAYNEEVYAKKEDLSEAEAKISENAENIAQNESKLADLSTYTRRELEAHTGQINSVSGRVQTIEDDYVVSDDIKDFAKKSDIPTDYVKESVYQIKIQEIESEISGKVENSDFVDYKATQKNVDDKQTEDIAANSQNIETVSGRVQTIESDYVKSEDISGFVDSAFVEEETSKTLNSAKSYTDGQIEFLDSDVSTKISKLNVSINNEFNRIWGENYVKHDEISDFSTKSELAEVEAKIPTDVVKHDEIADFATKQEVKDVEDKIPTDVVSHDEISDFVTNSSVSVNYAKKSEVEAVDSKLADYIKTDEAEAKFQPIGDYAEKSDLDDYAKKSEITDFITSEEAAETYATNEKVDGLVTGVSSVNGMSGEVVIKTTSTDYVDLEIKNTKDWVSENYQEAGDYATKSDVQEVDSKLADYLKSSDAEETYQKIGDYATNERVNEVEAKIPNDVVLHDEIADFVTDSSVKENYAKKSEVEAVDSKFADYLKTNDAETTYQKIGDYATNERVNQVESQIPQDVVSHDEIADFVTNSSVKENYATKQEVETVSGEIDQIETDYVEADKVLDNKIGSNTAQINEVSDRVSVIESDYVVSDQIKDFVTNSSVSINYATKSELESYAKTSELITGLNSKVSKDLSEINEAGEQKVKDIIATEGYLKEIPENDYATRSELNSSIANVSNWVSTNYAKKTALESYITEADGKLGKIDVSISTLNSSVNNLEKAGFLTSSDKTELEDLISGKQDAGDYATNDRVNQVENQISGKVDADFVNGKFDTLNSSVNANFQIKGDYATKSELADYYLKSNGEALESRVGTAETNISGIQSSLQSYNTRIADNALKNVEQDSSIRRLNTSVNTLESSIQTKQDKLVSSGENQNIKTINGEDILGTGDIEIQGGGGNHQNITYEEWEALTPEEKMSDTVYFITDSENLYATKEYVDNLVGDINTILENI